MTIREIHKMYETQPFQLFDLHLADGRSIHVAHPESLMLLPGSRAVVVGHADGTSEIVDLLLVASLKDRLNGPSHRNE